MAKLTLLKIVNNTLMALESSQVSTISETLESTSVARIAEECFFEMVSQGDWPHLTIISLLESLGDSSKPNYLRVSDFVKEIKYLEYNKKELKFLEKEEFLKLSNCRDLSLDNVVQVEDLGGVYFNIINDKDPEYYTSSLDEYLIFDSYNSSNESTLQGSNSAVKMTYTPQWFDDDSFVPELTTDMFPTYLALVKRAAFLYLRREQSMKDERAAAAGMGRLYRQESRINLGKGIKNYGR